MVIMRRMPRVLTVVVVLTLLGLAVLPAAAGDWPRFRGPNGTGIAADNDIPVRWGAESVVWKTPIPGVGNSSPVVAGGRVFLQSASADGRERWLLCLHAADGKVVWTRKLDGTPARKHPKNTLASSTPAVDGERVYALFWDGKDVTPVAYTFQGELAWKRSLGSFTSQHGPAASPMVFAGRVYLADDQDGSSVLWALEARTGQVTWKAARRPFRACYSTPFVWEKAGEVPQLIVSSTAGITSYNPKSGAENWDWSWSFAHAPLRTIGSPQLSGGLIIATSGDGSGDRHTVAIQPPDKATGSAPRLVWEAKRSFPYVPTVLAWGRHLYYVNDQGFAACCDATTGETIWSERLGGNVSASPILIDGKIYAIGEEGNAYVLAAAPRFQLLAKNSVGEPVLATPAVADHRLFVRGQQHLFCIAKPAVK
jgi:outer membrane protein assembly factor BamB